MTAVDTKNNLLALLNSASDVHELMTASETILIVLEHTEGLWYDAKYCYKASEIAEECRKRLDAYTTTCQHYKTHEKIARMRDKMRLLADRYHILQRESRDAEAAALV